MSEPAAAFEFFVAPERAGVAPSLTDAQQRLGVVGFEGRERLSDPYVFVLRTVSSALDPDAIERGFIGRRAHLCLSRESGRWVHGVVDRMRAEGSDAARPDERRFLVTLVPAFAHMSLRKRSRIFQDRTVPDIVSGLLADAGVALEPRLTRAYARRDYCVQHQETDRGFVERLLAEEGIFYFFLQPDDPRAEEILVLADEASACRPIHGDATLHARERAGVHVGDDGDVWKLKLRRRVAPDAVALREFDYLRPSFDLRGDASDAPSPEFEQYHHHAELEPNGVDDGAARRRLEQHRRAIWVARGRSRTPRIAPGSTATIDGSELGKSLGAYTFVEVEHEGYDTFYMPASAARPTYRNRFRAVPSATPYRPAPPAPRVQQGLETATIVGPAGEEIHTDEHGRVKVQFHWDREGRRDEHASCWLRVMQPWAGAGWGFQFIPRVGMEVMVGFLAGDTDKPVVLGSLYNAEHPPSFPLPADKTKSGVRTQSSPRGGGGFNELSFDDRKGGEAIFLHAERNLTETIEVDHNTHVKNARKVVTDGAHTETVGADMTLTVGGHKRDRVTANRSSGTGGSVSIQTSGNHDETVHGGRALRVGGSSSARFDKSALVRVGADASATVLGALSVSVGAAGGAPATLHGKGAFTVASDTDVVITATKSVTLSCGSSVVRLTPDGVSISAKSVTIEGSDAVKVHGKDALLELGAEAKLAAPATRLFGKSASMEVSTSAFVKGTAIRLGAREGDPPSDAPATAPTETQTLALLVSDGGFNPLRSRPFELTVDGVRYAGTTSGDGTMSQSIPKSATRAQLLVWEGEPPSGTHHTWSLQIGEPPPVESLEGARSRLANLGYRVGEGDALDPVTARAVEDFQRDHGAEQTGELDAPTLSLLQDVHGH